jgi:hypothetical protein
MRVTALLLDEVTGRYVWADHYDGDDRDLSWSAVAPYPEAREAVIAALRDLDATSSVAPALEDLRCRGAVADG